MKARKKSKSNLILLVAMRPSDYTEMKKAMFTLREKNFQLAFLYVKTGYQQDALIKEEIHTFWKQGILKCYFIQKETEFFLNEVKISNPKKPAALVKKEVGKKKEKLPKKPLKKPLKKKSWLRRFLGRGFYKVSTTFVRYKACLNWGIILGKLVSLFCTEKQAKSARNLIKVALIFRIYRGNYKEYKKIFKLAEAGALVLPEDIVGFVSPLLIKAAHKNNVPSIILPYTICNQSEAFQSLKTNPSNNLDAPGNWLIAKFFKRWCLKREGIALLRLPFPYVLGHFITRTSPPDPWMMNSGYANAIAVESQRMFDYYVESGVCAKKLKIVGTINDDAFTMKIKDKKILKEKLYKNLNISGNKPLLLIGGCPDQTTSKVPQFEFETIDRCMEFITNELNLLRKFFTLIMRPHPNAMQLGDFYKKAGIFVTEIPTNDLIPLADLYLAHASATIRWAIACAVPVINYDIFGYYYDDFTEVSGVVQAHSKTEFRKALKLVQSDFFNSLQEDVKTSSKGWGMLDGRSTSRIVQLIEETLALKKVKRIPG